MKSLLVALSVVAALLLLFGCAGAQTQAVGSSGANAGANPPIQGQGAAAKTGKVILTGPAELPGGKVGKPYSYIYCIPNPDGKLGLCGGTYKTTNPRGGNGPYTFYLGAGQGFLPFGLALNTNGVLSGTPTAAGERKFEVCAKDIGGDYGCANSSLRVIEDAGLAGVWELAANSLMNGPEGSFPEGCAMEQKFQLNLTQNANALGGVAVNRLTKTTGCGIWSVDIKTPDKMQVSGTYAAPSIAFTVGNIDFTGTWTGTNITGTMATCHSPDARCTKSGMQQLNWYAGNFTATPAN